MRLGSAADALDRGLAGGRDFDRDHAPVLRRRQPPHPSPLRHRADRIRHRRQADALPRGKLGQRLWLHAEHRQQAEVGRRRQLSRGAQLGGHGAHHQRNDLQNIAGGVTRMGAFHATCRRNR